MSLLLATALALFSSATGEDPLILTGAHVLAPTGDHWLEDTVLVVQDGRIQSVARPSAPSADGLPPGARVIDLEGSYLIPGLIDLHAHLLLRPYDERSWNDQVLRESLELRTIRAVPAARATLLAGFTTLRELGTEGAAFADVALRDAIATGIIEGPRIFAATRALVATGCYGPSGFDPRWDVPKGAQVADGPDGVRRAVREQIAAGADWIKVYADYRRKAGGPSTPTYTLEELRAIVDEATSAGLPVAAHASTEEAIQRAVRAGVRTIEHGTQASLVTLRAMRAGGVTLCPTLAASEAIARYGGWLPGTPEPERVQASRALMERALEAGVQIGCGSDVGVFTHGENARELQLMVAYGMTPQAALWSATGLAAEVLKRAEDLGRIAPDFVADLVAFRGDPLISPDALQDPLFVMARGKVVLDRL